jgi:toxin CcdB
VAQWDVYPNPSERARGELPFVVDVQSDLLAGLRTRLVVPLAAEVTAALPPRMCPRLDIGARRLQLLPQEAGAVPANSLRRPVVSLRVQQHQIVDALDAVISGV